MYKRTFFVLGAMLIIGLLLTSCQPTTVIETVIVEVEGETVIKEVVVGAEAVEFMAADTSTIVDVTIGDNDTLDPAWNYETSGNQKINNIYDPLVTYDREDATSFVPALAESWEMSADGLTYTFQIRQGVKFHDGADMTPEDVAYSFQRGVLQGGGWSPQWLYTEALFGTGTYDVAELIDPALADDPEGLQAADPDALLAACETVTNAFVADEANWTVTMTLAEPWGPWISTIANTWGSVLDKDWAIANGTWDGECANWAKFYGVTSETTPLRAITNGTGPYMLDHWTPGEETVLVANPNYWREEQDVPLFEGGPSSVQVERIVVKGIDEWGTRFAMAKAGDADTFYVPRQNVAQIDPLVGELCTWDAAASDFVCAASEYPNQPLRLFMGHPLVVRSDAFFNFDVNVEGGNNYVGSGKMDGNGIPADFFSDEHVRLAFQYCFDHEAFIADALAGEAVQGVGPLIPGMVGYDQDGPHYTYDVEMCQAEIEKAWDGKVAENGFRFQIAFNSGNVTRQTVAEILQANFSDIDPKYQIEIIGLPWPSFLSSIRAKRLPVFVSGWQEDIHDPHNWAQPFMVGTYAARQNMPAEMLAEFKALVSAGVGAAPEDRDEIYKELTALDYKYTPAIRLAIATGRHYEQRWVEGYYYNPIFTFQDHWMTMGKKQLIIASM